MESDVAQFATAAREAWRHGRRTRSR
jgi:hypothetical protein